MCFNFELVDFNYLCSIVSLEVFHRIWIRPKYSARYSAEYYSVQISSIRHLTEYSVMCRIFGSGKTHVNETQGFLYLGH